jgi:hypothetical protein
MATDTANGGESRINSRHGGSEGGGGASVGEYVPRLAREVRSIAGVRGRAYRRCSGSMYAPHPDPSRAREEGKTV